MRRMGLVISLLALLLTTQAHLPSADEPETLPVVAAFDTGETMEEWVPSRTISENTGTLLAELDASVTLALGSTARDPLARARDAAREGSLVTVVVGAGIEAQIGLGSLIKVSAAPRLRVAFSKGDDVQLP